MTPWEQILNGLFQPTHLISREWIVREVDCRNAKAFIAKFHYSIGSSLTGVYFHGLFKKNNPEQLMGVAQWLPPTKPTAVSVSANNWRRVLSLSRLVVHPTCPTNAASFLMARSIRIIRNEGKWTSLVTYADQSQGHRGQIYRATNWHYLGISSVTPRWIDPMTGKQVAILSTKSRTKQQMLDLGYKCVGKFPKHKFVMHL